MFKTKLTVIILVIISALLMAGIIGFSLSYFINQYHTQQGSGSIVLSMAGYSYQEGQIDPLIKSYEKLHPNITIIYRQIDKASYASYLINSFHSSSPVNIFEAQSTDQNEFLKYTSVAPQSILTAKQFNSTYYPLFDRGLLFDNYYVLGIPQNIQPLIVVYNKDLAQKADINIPSSLSSLDSFNNTIKAFRQKTTTIAGINIGIPNNIDEAGDILQLFMLENNTPMNDKTNKVAINNTEGLQALQYYNSFISGDFNDSWQSTSPLDDLTLFARGNVLMLLTYPENIPTIMQINPSIHLGYAVFPSLGNALTLGHYDYIAVSDKSTNSDTAWDFLNYISQKDNYLSLASQVNVTNPYSLIPPRMDTSATVTLDLQPVLKAVLPITKDWNMEDAQNTNKILKAVISDYSQNSTNGPYLLSLAERDLNNLIQKSFAL